MQVRKPLLLIGALLMVATLTLKAPAAQAADDTLELIRPGSLTIGFNPFPGIFEVSDKGVVSGIFGILVTDVAKSLGLKPVYVPLAFPALIPALQSHRIDVNSGSFSITQPRAQILYYATPWLFGPETIAVLPGTKIPTWDYAAANHLTLATGVGYYYVGTWEDMKINVHTFDSDDACFEDAVKGGAAGCSVGLGSYVLHKLQAPNGPTAKLVSIMVGGPNINGDPNGLAISKDHPALARAVSHAVDELYRNGTVAQTVCEVLQNLPECKLFQLPAQGQGLYLPGPWEVGTLPPASANYPHDVPTVKSGALTVGVTGTSPMLQVSDDGTLKGPEADILNFVAGKLGLTLKGSVVNEVAAALQHGDVDLGAGALAATEEASHKYWQTEPVGFNPDYIYVAPTSSGGLPPYTRWEDVKAAGGKIAVVRGNPRVADLTAAGVDLLLVTDATAGLKALVDKSAAAFVGSSLDYVAAASTDSAIANAGIGWTRNGNSYSNGAAYAWGVKAGNAKLIDSINQAIVAAWQGNVIASAYGKAFPGANTSVLTAPGPTAIGTSSTSSKDYVFRAMWFPGAWVQRPDWVK